MATGANRTARSLSPPRRSRTSCNAASRARSASTRSPACSTAPTPRTTRSIPSASSSRPPATTSWPPSRSPPSTACRCCRAAAARRSSGQTVGAALVIDFSKVLSRVLDIDLEGGFVTVEPGINIDALNRQLKPQRRDVRPRSRLRQSRHRRRRRRQQLDRLALDPLRHDRRQRAGRDGRHGRRRRSRPRSHRARRDGRPGQHRRRQGTPLQPASGVPGTLRRVDRPRFPAALASRHRLLTRPVAQTRRRVQPGPVAGLFRRHPGHTARGHIPARAETDEDRPRAASVRRARRLHGRDPGDPRDRSLRGRADGPHADQSHAIAARLSRARSR